MTEDGACQICGYYKTIHEAKIYEYPTEDEDWEFYICKDCIRRLKNRSNKNFYGIEGVKKK